MDSVGTGKLINAQVQGRSLAMGSVLELGAQALVLPVGLITAAFLTRQLGAGLYGELSAAAAIVLIIELVAVLMFSRTTVKFVAETADWRPVASTLAQAQLAVGVVSALVLVAAAPLLAWGLDSPELTGYLRLLALDIPLFALATAHQSILIGRGAFVQRSVMSVSTWLTRLALVFLLVGAGLSVHGAVLAYIGASAMQLAIGVAFVRVKLFSRPAFPVNQLWGYALPLFLYAVGMLLFSRIDLLLVKSLGGSEEAAGFYGAAQNITIVPGSFFNAAVAPLLLATLARALREGRVRDAQAVTGHAIRVTLYILPFAGVAAGASQEITPLLYGAAFQPAAPLFALLAFAALALSMISVNTAVLTAYGKPRMTFMLIAPLVLLAVVAHVILIPRYGAVGAAMVTAVLAWVGACATLLAVSRHAGVFPSLASVLRVGGVTVIAFLLASAWHTEGVWVVMELVCLSGFALVALYLLREVTRSDLGFVRSLLGRQLTASDGRGK